MKKTLSVVLTATCLFAGAASVWAQAGLPAPSDTKSDPGAFNPAISAIVDTFFHVDNSDEGISHVMEEISGFGHAHGGHEGHEHKHGVEEGFNLRHLELQFSADVDPYFKASAIAAIDVESAEMEVAEIETTSLPGGLKLKAGKFYSGFGRINAQHAHEWDFTDQPLIYNLTLGEHGLNDKGAQVSWLAPTPFYLLAGAEAFQGDNEKMFAYHGEEPLPAHNGPRVLVGWLKLGPDLPGGHAVQAGVSAGRGKHQEEHDGDADGESDHWLDGHSTFWGADFVYKFNSPKSHGEGDFVLQTEYFQRKKDLELLEHELAPQFVGNSRVEKQDGYYVQAVYGVLPRWRAGLRWEQVGLANDIELPSGASEELDPSARATAMVDFTPTEFSRLRFQVNHGRYETDEGREDVWEAYVQLMVSLGAHGAHKF